MISMKKLLHLVEASRPKTLPAALSPLVLSLGLAIADNVFHLWSFLAALTGALLIQIGTNYANDYYDFKKGTDNENRVGPRRATQAGLLSAKTMKIAFIVTFGLAFIPGTYLVYRAGEVIIFIGVASVASGILYTATRYALAYTGLADIFVIIFFGPVAVGGAYYVQALSVPVYVIIAGFSTGLFSTAILTANNLRDYPSDKEANKKTLVVRFGLLFGKTEYTLMVVLATAVSIPVYYFSEYTYEILYSLLMFIPAVILIIKLFSVTERQDYIPLLGKTALLGLAFSISFSTLLVIFNA